MKLYHSSHKNLIKKATRPHNVFFLTHTRKKHKSFNHRNNNFPIRKQLKNFSFTRKNAPRSFKMFIPMSGSRKCGGCGRH